MGKQVNFYISYNLGGYIKMQKRIYLTFLTIMMVAALLISVSAMEGNSATEATYVLRFGHVQTSQDLFHKAYEAWAKAVGEKTNGDLLIEVYPDAQLGVEEDVLEQMRMGSNIGWQTDPARLGNYVNDIAVLNCPYFLENLDEVKKLLDSKVVGGWIQELEDKFGFKIISYAYVQGYRSVFSNKLGKNPTEFRGMRIRTAPAPSWVEPVKSLGCTAVALPYVELYNGIQTGIVDGCELPYAAARALKVYEVAEYIIETQHIYQLNIQVCSAEWFNKLPEEYQKILIDECNKAGLEVSEQLQRNADQDRQFMIDQGMTYIPHDDLDVEAFKRAGQAAYDVLKVGEAREAVYAEIGKTVVK